MKRNHAIDTFRGLLLVIMTINHLAWISGGYSIVQYVTLQPLGQIGAAEGFIFVSGLMVGLIYSVKPMDIITNKLLHRAKEIYLYHLGFMLVVIAIALFYLAVLPASQSIFNANLGFILSDPLVAVPLSLTLVHKPGYFDILPMYIAFLCVSPIIIQLLQKGLWMVVMAVSVGLWLASDYVVLSEMTSDTAINTGYFSWLAWQMPFFIGTTLGFFHRQHQVAWFKHRWLTALIATIATLLFAAHHNAFAAWGITQFEIYQLANKPTLGWLRITYMLLWVYLFGFLFSHFPKAFTFKPLANIGANSLKIFSFHYVICFALAPLAATQAVHGLVPTYFIVLGVAALFLPMTFRKIQSTFLLRTTK